MSYTAGKILLTIYGICSKAITSCSSPLAVLGKAGLCVMCFLSLAQTSSRFHLNSKMWTLLKNSFGASPAELLAHDNFRLLLSKTKKAALRYVCSGLKTLLTKLSSLKALKSKLNLVIQKDLARRGQIEMLAELEKADQTIIFLFDGTSRHVAIALSKNAENPRSARFPGVVSAPFAWNNTKGDVLRRRPALSSPAARWH